MAGLCGHLTLWPDTDEDAPATYPENAAVCKKSLSVSTHNLTPAQVVLVSHTCQPHYIQLLRVFAKESEMQNIFPMCAWPVSVSVHLLLCSLLALSTTWSHGRPGPDRILVEI